MFGSLVGEVLALQSQYSSQNTDAMKSRGLLIREQMPKEIASIRQDLAYRLGIEPLDVLIEGSDGTGLKARVPWVRYSSRAMSPAATAGWYVVWLHREDGAGAYLAIAHGSAQFRDGALISRSDQELATLVAWAKAAINSEIAGQDRLTSKVDLASRAPLPLAYEKSCVAAFYYPREAIADDHALQVDMLFMASLLGKLYEAERQGKTPLSKSPEVLAAEASARAISKPSQKKGQGFLLNAQERRVIELHAMAMAGTHLKAQGFTIKDVSASESFDLLAMRGDEAINVEVKGTTGLLGEILLTRNEVELHKACHPNNALIVVHSIQLIRGVPPTATGGKLEAWQPWMLDPERLTALSYSYAL